MKRNVFCKYVITFAVVVFGLFAVGCENKTSKTATIDVNECIRKVAEAIKKGDYTEAYLIADQMIALDGILDDDKRDAGCNLNRKILTNEIATNVEEGNTARIILCIKERARFNKYQATYDDFYRKKEEIEMLKHASQLAVFVENDDMAQKLQNALDTWEKEAAEEEKR